LQASRACELVSSSFVAAAGRSLRSALQLDGVISRVDGVLMLAAFLTWLIATLIEARRERSGVPELIIGATVVAVRTSVPELATAVIAELKGHDEVGLGTVLGSNIFNGLFIVAPAAIIHPIAVGSTGVFVALVFGLVALACSFPPKNGFIERRRGLLLLALYAMYLTTVLQLAALRRDPSLSACVPSSHGLSTTSGLKRCANRARNSLRSASPNFRSAAALLMIDMNVFHCSPVIPSPTCTGFISRPVYKQGPPVASQSASTISCR
jgi:Ca2+/Na+ antiporter